MPARYCCSSGFICVPDEAWGPKRRGWYPVERNKDMSNNRKEVRPYKILPKTHLKILWYSGFDYSCVSHGNRTVFIQIADMKRVINHR